MTFIELLQWLSDNGLTDVKLNTINMTLGKDHGGAGVMAGSRMTDRVERLLEVGAIQRLSYPDRNGNTLYKVVDVELARVEVTQQRLVAL